MGRAGMASLAVSTIGTHGVKALAGVGAGATSPQALPFEPLKALTQDNLVLAQGFDYKVLLAFNDALNSKARFGTHSDYTAYLPLQKNKPLDGLLWVNHEYTHPMLVSGHITGPKSKEQVEQEMRSVGGSIVRIAKQNGTWRMLKDEHYNRRIDALTPIPFAWPEPIANTTFAIGTLGNCAGGTTPWGTVLTCEENYDQFWGESDYSNVPGSLAYEGHYQWQKYYQHPPEHYGWVVEINPQTGQAQKLVAMGRCAHECATVHALPDGRCVVYTGDDANDQCLYRFVSHKPNDLTQGTLYVANLEKGQWVAVDFDQQEVLRQHFKSQTEVLIRLREAAALLGGTPLDRPEDIEIDPATGNVFISMTNNKPKGRYMGHILKLMPSQGNHEAQSFSSETFMAGGAEMGFACPDNLAFDPKGNLWFTTDISGSSIEKGPYKGLGNNGLFYVPMQGPNAGQALKVASAPVDAEFTGPTFAPDGQTLFLSVQHPGERSKPGQYTSNWPRGGNQAPRSAVVAISGKAMQDLLA